MVASSRDTPTLLATTTPGPRLRASASTRGAKTSGPTGAGSFPPPSGRMGGAASGTKPELGNSRSRPKATTCAPGDGGVRQSEYSGEKSRLGKNGTPSSPPTYENLDFHVPNKIRAHVMDSNGNSVMSFGSLGHLDMGLRRGKHGIDSRSDNGIMEERDEPERMFTIGDLSILCGTSNGCKQENTLFGDRTPAGNRAGLIKKNGKIKSEKNNGIVHSEKHAVIPSNVNGQVKQSNSKYKCVFDDNILSAVCFGSNLETEILGGDSDGTGNVEICSSLGKNNGVACCVVTEGRMAQGKHGSRGDGRRPKDSSPAQRSTATQSGIVSPDASGTGTSLALRRSPLPSATDHSPIITDKAGRSSAATASLASVKNNGPREGLHARRHGVVGPRRSSAPRALHLDLDNMTLYTDDSRGGILLKDDFSSRKRSAPQSKLSPGVSPSNDIGDKLVNSLSTRGICDHLVTRDIEMLREASARSATSAAVTTSATHVTAHVGVHGAAGESLRSGGNIPSGRLTSPEQGPRTLADNEPASARTPVQANECKEVRGETDRGIQVDDRVAPERYTPDHLDQGQKPTTPGQLEAPDLPGNTKEEKDKARHGPVEQHLRREEEGRPRRLGERVHGSQSHEHARSATSQRRNNKGGHREELRSANIRVHTTGADSRGDGGPGLSPGSAMDRSSRRPFSTSSSVSSSNVLLDGIVEGETLCDPFDPDDDNELSDTSWACEGLSSCYSLEAAANTGYSTSSDSIAGQPRGGGSSSAASNFDIVGQTAGARFPWQRDVAVQCTIMRWTPRRLGSIDAPDRRELAVFSDHEDYGCDEYHRPRRRRCEDLQDSLPTRARTYSGSSSKSRRTTSRGRVPSGDLGGGPAASGSSGVDDGGVESRRRLAKTLTEGIDMMYNDARNSGSKAGEQYDPAKSPYPSRVMSMRSKPIITRTTSAGSAPKRPQPDLDNFSLDQWPPTDIAERTDTLTSPRISPVPWLRPTVPELVVTSLHGETAGQRSGLTKSSSKKDNFLAVPSRKPLRRKSSGSLQSNSDDSDTDTPSIPPVTRRGRRQAICDSKNFEDVSPSNSCDESEGSSASSDKPSRRMRKRSSGDLGINYPGDLLVHGRRKKVLIKRNTIADFANTKAYQGSIASLISEQDNKKKPTSSFSLIKLIQDKKGHRTKENVASLSEILSHMKRSDFKDNNLTCYKDSHWSELIASKDKDGGCLVMDELERKRREAVWELFLSECVFLIDHLMVLKHCFMEPLKKVQVEGYLMFTEPQDLFGNLDELCYVSYTFCRDFISVLLKDASATDFGRTEVLVMALQKFSQLTRDGEVYHEYCLNYSKAVSYLDQLRKNEDFSQFEKWCEHDPRCHRLQLTDLLISPMQHCTKVPLLLANIRKYTENPDQKQQLTEALEKLETSLKSLETKMKWLKNFERVQEIQQQIMWQAITELEPRAFIPEFLKANLMKQPCERLLASPKRQLLHEGPLTLLEINKTIDMYMLLFDDILLLTRVKKPPRKKSTAVADTNLLASPRVHTDGAVFVVHRQPIALDRFTIHDVRPPDAAATGLKNAFVLVQISRFQQIIGVYTLQAPSEAAKAVWLTRLHDAQKQYKTAIRRTDSVSSSTMSFDTGSVNMEDGFLERMASDRSNRDKKSSNRNSVDRNSVDRSTADDNNVDRNGIDRRSSEKNSINRNTPERKPFSRSNTPREGSSTQTPRTSISKDSPEKDWEANWDTPVSTSVQCSNIPSATDTEPTTERLFHSSTKSASSNTVKHVMEPPPRISAIPPLPRNIPNRHGSPKRKPKVTSLDFRDVPQSDGRKVDAVSLSANKAGILMSGIASTKLPITSLEQNGDHQSQTENTPRESSTDHATLSRLQRLKLLKVIHEKSHSTDSLDMLDPVYI